MTLRDAIAGRTLTLVMPTGNDDLGSMIPLLRLEIAEFEAVFDAPVVISYTNPVDGPRWTIRIDPDAGANRLIWDRDNAALTTIARDAAGVMTSFNLLHTLVWSGVESVSDAHEPTMDDVVARIDREIAATYPSFALRGIDWQDVCRRHVPAEPASTSVADLQAWVAELDDAHTAIRPTRRVYHPPYAVEVGVDNAVFRRVPEQTAAWEAGVRPGWTLADVVIDELWRGTPSPRHAKALLAGRRALHMIGTEERTFSAVSPSGTRATWIERVIAPALTSVFTARRIDQRTAYIRLTNWFTGLGLEDAFDQALTEFADVPRLVVDLRGNTGGNLVLATDTRRRFLRERTHLGSIQFTRGDGTLAPPVDLWADPHERRVCWNGELIVLTDPLTYSASEDFLHGLQGLPHVTVIGAPSGGGSGRPRLITLNNDLALTVSTALTFTRDGHCIENAGIQVDLVTDPFADDLLSSLP